MHLGAAIIAALSLTGYAFPRQRPGYLRMLPRANDTEISCGQTEYTLTEVRSAADAACQHVEDGTTAGSSSYPHTYRNQEGFDFNGVEGPFVEFPMKTSGVYKGGKPGADRVIINEKCVLAGQITHTGANGNAFVGCEGTS
ncbi:Extracellular guanyl-specific ribonuclease [Colletotrichum siamense]|uniref:ribonuclease T1 n=1 Tax=Colletotrichum siamense TaxID=690259 RepID=A0A9P5EQL6_COLSI|nr:Extracellular guanyl-specific ribonuclease [Colletotrichum siamense]KAF4832622.1 Extracellular guanyl-specific ribonuclease [Colletotrichum siamense]KAF4857815.1 Extracellular guanyl-specific ribonuclease [Colletotrichum siamense]